MRLLRVSHPGRGVGLSFSHLTIYSEAHWSFIGGCSLACLARASRPNASTVLSSRASPVALAKAAIFDAVASYVRMHPPRTSSPTPALMALTLVACGPAQPVPPSTQDTSATPEVHYGRRTPTACSPVIAVELERVVVDDRVPAAGIIRRPSPR